MRHGHGGNGDDEAYRRCRVQIGRLAHQPGFSGMALSQYRELALQGKNGDDPFLRALREVMEEKGIALPLSSG